jgi:hypothetical protein
MRYLKRTQNQGLLSHRDGEKTIECYSDADWAGDLNDRRSTSVSWRSKKQTNVALSTAEAEYIMALASAAQEAIWLRQLNSELNHPPPNPTVVYESAIAMTKNPKFHGRAKHISNIILFASRFRMEE